ncbi:MAG: hypothetical protein AAGF47_01280, partial [Planctomycetota bacterium]
MAHTARLLTMLLFASLALSASAETERYYAVYLGDQRAGWLREREERDEETIRSMAEMRFAVGRGSAKIEIRIETEFIETTDHRPIRMSSSQAIAAAPVVTEYEFGDSAVRITTRQGDTTTTRDAPLPEAEWVTPGAAATLLQTAIENGKAPVPITTLDPAFGLTPVVTTRTLPTETEVEVLGRLVPAVRTLADVSVSTGPAGEEFWGLDGRLVKSTSTIGGISITMLATDRGLALAELDPPEIMQQTF